jgi:hypothetical protein
VGHLNVDLYYPCIKSTIIDWFLAKWFSQLSLATSKSGLPWLSLLSTYGFFLTLFKSSCNPSNKNVMSSDESCY